MPIVKPEEFKELLDRYLAGQTTPEETELLHQVYDRLERDAHIGPNDLPDAKAMEEAFVKKLKPNEGAEPGIKLGALRYLTLAARHWRGIAASILILVAGPTFIFNLKTENHVRSPLTGDLITYQNNHHFKERIRFEDQSYVELEKGSSIVYNKHFEVDKRQVYLKGRAFFQISKNHSRPFIVYTDQVVTKVLGTSFIVDNVSANRPASVTVLTGRVAVYKKDQFKPEYTRADFTGGVLITPNQSVAFAQKQPLQKTIAKQPSVLSGQQHISFNFDNTPLDTVFARLYQAYGIEIRYPSNQYQGCTLSVNMGNEDFYQKLELIARTLNLRYRLKDAAVVIEGNGCSE